MNNLLNSNLNNALDSDNSSINDSFPKKVDLQSEAYIESKKIDAGILGKLFGSNSNTAIHISGLICLILVTAGIFSFFTEKYEVIWRIINPLIASCLGYIFGKTK